MRAPRSHAPRSGRVHPGCPGVANITFGVILIFVTIAALQVLGSPRSRTPPSRCLPSSSARSRIIAAVLILGSVTSSEGRGTILGHACGFGTDKAIAGLGITTAGTPLGHPHPNRAGRRHGVLRHHTAQALDFPQVVSSSTRFWPSAGAVRRHHCCRTCRESSGTVAGAATTSFVTRRSCLRCDGPEVHGHRRFHHYPAFGSPVSGRRRGAPSARWSGCSGPQLRAWRIGRARGRHPSPLTHPRGSRVLRRRDPGCSAQQPQHVPVTPTGRATIPLEGRGAIA